MPEALARTRTDFQVSRRSPAASKRGRGRLSTLLHGFGRFVIRQLSVRPATTAAGAGFAALMTGIVINALVLQTMRHPAPFFASPRPAVETPARAAARPAAAPVPASARPAAAPAPVPGAAAPHPVAAAKAGESSAPAGVKDPITQYLKAGGEAHPAEPRHAAAETGKTKQGDPIGQLLRNGHPSAPASAAVESDAAVLAAQRALMKLGFVVKPDGVMGATTRQAIEQFERDHHLPVKGDLTARIARTLAATAGMKAD